MDDLDAELRTLSTTVDRPLATEPDVDPEPQVKQPLWRSLTRVDVAAMLSMVAMALFLTSPLWLNLDHELREDPQDQAFFEWMLAHGARVLTDGVSPFFSDRLNYPDGMNMMANTSVLAISLPLTPVTLLFGPHVAFNVFLTLALAVTGIAWYLVLSRKFVTSRTAAWVGAIFATFAPSMVSHAGGHPNIVSQFLVPVLIWRTLELRRPGRAVRNGAILAGVVVWQAFINLEVLFMTAVGVGLFCGVMAIQRRRDTAERATVLKGLGVTAAISLAALAYPLYVQFFGPQAYHGLSEFVRYFGADLGSFTAYARRSIAGDDATASRLAQNAAEENAFFGWGLVILFAGLVVWMRRSVAVLAAAGVAVFFAAMSLGPQIYLNGRPTGVAGLWAYLHSVPVLNSAVPTRWAMAIAPVIAIVLALGCQRAVELGRRQPAARGPLRLAICTAVAMALVPLFPTPLPSRPMDPVPSFITSDQWRGYVDDQHSLVALPLPNSSYPDPLRWAAYTKNDLRIARGYGLFPAQNPMNPSDRTGQFEGGWRPTSGLFASIKAGYPTPQLTDARREMTLADLRFWKAGVVVLTPQDRDIEMRRAMSEIIGFQPTWTGDVWMWDVRALVDDPSASITTASP
ncbi:hypothetical protein [Spirilliplanes yamanashiensis]|uniref:Glycosyl transferase n=1 Tax=Spirilliplanes yamanashiensis TaxID=42233 RepID=A0A8J3Y6H7_9ACTN|nr:hypothetical protein [Spirilliplanes yamanashiensis]MDP9814796.1 hypothetical protein [Spirilliplanes yamanashiensis]GIJ02450.1 glycosyl transferase [Spirilliplanes yamanashiensis]